MISAKFTSLYKTDFSARDRHVLSFSHWAHHVLAIFSKVHTFVQNSLFSPRSAHFVIFALGTPLFSDFQQSAHVCTKQPFQPDISTFCYFCTERTIFLAISSKVNGFVQNTVFSPTSEGLRFFALCTPLFSNFPQIARVCAN